MDGMTITTPNYIEVVIAAHELWNIQPIRGLVASEPKAFAVARHIRERLRAAGVPVKPSFGSTVIEMMDGKGDLHWVEDSVSRTVTYRYYPVKD